MKDEKIQNIITELENKNDKEKAYFGFYQYGGGPDESCIRGNRKGIELFAVELLKASLESEKNNYEEEQFSYSEIDIEWTDDNGDFFFDSIEITNRDKKDKDDKFPEYKHKSTFKSKLIDLIMIAIVSLFLLCLVTGIITVGNWIF